MEQSRPKSHLALFHLGYFPRFHSRTVEEWGSVGWQVTRPGTPLRSQPHERGLRDPISHLMASTSGRKLIFRPIAAVLQYGYAQSHPSLGGWSTPSRGGRLTPAIPIQPSALPKPPIGPPRRVKMQEHCTPAAIASRRPDCTLSPTIFYISLPLLLFCPFLQAAIDARTSTFSPALSFSVRLCRRTGSCLAFTIR